MAQPARVKRASRAVRVGPSPNGLGVYARCRFRARETIAEIQGEVIGDPDYWSAYCIDLGCGEVLEPSAPFRYLNHSCNPNSELVDSTAWNDRTGVLRHATRLKSLTSIAAGEQLTIDYAWPASCAIPCLCGSENCRGWIVAPDELVTLTATRP